MHSHTWYANLGGHLAKLLHGIPHVMTVHSLEPLRPWKAEQLGGGYRISSWAEQTAVEAADAVIAVSFGMRNDVIGAYRALDPDHVHVIHNGIDTEFWAPTEETDVLERLGVDLDRPYVASSAASPARRACRTSCGPRCTWTPRCSSCCWPARPTPRTWPARPRPPSTRSSHSAAACSGWPSSSPGPRSARC